MVFSGNKKLYIRRALFALLVVLSAAVQHTDGALPSFSGAKAMIIIPLCVCIAMFERSMGGLAFGVLCGVMWDAASARSDGFFSVCLAVVGFTAGALITYFMRNNILSALIISGAACLLVNSAYWLVFILLKGFDGAYGVLMSFYLPCAFYSFLYTFLYYYLIRLIVQITSEGKGIRQN